MIQKVTAVLLALIITLGVGVPTSTIMQAQAQDNATSTTNTTTTETNTTIPLEPTQLPVFPEEAPPEATQLPVFPEEGPPQASQLPVFPEDELTPPQADNQTQPEAEAPGPVSRDNATIVLGLLDNAQINIDEARNIILALQAQIEAGEQQPVNDTEEIIQDANDTTEDIIDIIEEEVTNDTEVVDDIGNTTDDIIDVIEDSIESNDNATVDNIENVTDEVIEIIDNSTEDVDNSTTEVALDNAMIRLLTGLVSAQDYNTGLAQEERDDLKANLQDAIADLASDAANALR